jgi:transposase
MNVPNKFVSPLNEKMLKQLDSLVKHSENIRVRQRAHAIILSSNKFSIDEIASIFSVGRNAVSSWITKWEQLGFDGLNDKDRPGGPSKLNDSEKELLFDLAKQTPRSITSMITALFEQTGKRLNESSIKRFLKNAGLKWKRIRKTTNKLPNPEEFEAAKQELYELKKQHNNEELELWFMRPVFRTQCALCLATY